METRGFFPSSSYISFLAYEEPPSAFAPWLRSHVQSPETDTASDRIYCGRYSGHRSYVRCAFWVLASGRALRKRRRKFPRRLGLGAEEKLRGLGWGGEWKGSRWYMAGVAFLGVVISARIKLEIF